MNRTNKILQAYPQAPWRVQVQILVVVLLLVISIAVVGTFLLSVTARTSTIGREIQEMQVTISAMEIENAALQTDLAYLTSYEVMQKRAARLGYDLNTMEMTDFLAVDGYAGRQIPRLAESSRIITPVVVNEMPGEYTESVFNWLSRKLLERTLPVLELEP
jgi:cell division protein FtsL